MAGVAGVNRANAAYGRPGDEDRQIVIDRAAFCAAVFGKANLARAARTPLESARLQGLLVISDTYSALSKVDPFLNSLDSVDDQLIHQM